LQRIRNKECYALEIDPLAEGAGRYEARHAVPPRELAPFDDEEHGHVVE
jgi:hypothetical protein